MGKKGVLNFRIKILPSDWVSADAARREMEKQAAMADSFFSRWIVAFFLPLLFGSLIGYFGPPVNKDFVAALVSAVGVLAGFTVTMMLFTGRMPGSEQLSIESTVDYVDKICYLLRSQCAALMSMFFTLLVCGLWLIFDGVKAAPWSDLSPMIQRSSGIFLIGLLFLTSTKVILLPYQIYELQRFTLEQLKRAKNLENKKSILEQRNLLKSSKTNDKPENLDDFKDG
ncbi:hypothetical protein C7443_10564 [Plasticicumulans acidivorans]|uniref:Uncharacterized protein n=2 Tax=Plasticicumulans acidivorans TaxID=886464 RepID=A0A317MUG0_9GAMM|nr:hypothetical protein C7443_10564 [Plasticicumulans acidivorans]